MINNQTSLWSPSEEYKKKSKLFEFCQLLNEKQLIKNTDNFENLWRWSVNNPEIFWSQIWDFTKIKGEKGKIVIKKNKNFFKNKFFPDSKLNYAENLLPKRNNEIA